jgi:hypothetical protein
LPEVAEEEEVSLDPQKKSLCSTLRQ